MTTALKILHEYKANASDRAVYRDDGKSVGCLTLAKKANELGVKTLGVMAAIRYVFLDLLSYLPLGGRWQFRVLQAEILPTLNKKIDEINVWGVKNFKCVESNVGAVEDAKVVCLGETHISSRHRRNNGSLIDLLATKTLFKGSLALVESVPANCPPQLPNAQASYVKTPIPLKGWDDYKEVQTSLDHLDCVYLGAMLVLSPIILSPPSSFLAVTGSLMTTYSFAHIQNSIIPRNRSMCKTIDDNEAAHTKIFAIAGSNHLQKPSLNQSVIYKLIHLLFFRKWSAPVSQCVEETLSHLRSKQFAVLVPKDSFLSSILI